ncbi:MAG: DUF4116 domain-containing protein [Treponema sp.]|jgi:hypothetical protein|nr:DUF4116 domain-containing protein [Treponema sp.]
MLINKDKFWLETVDMCLEKMKQNTSTLQDLKTAEMLCIKAVKHNGRALRLVPKEFKTAEMCVEAVKQNKEASKYVPAKMWLEIVKQDCRSFRYVPEEFKTQEMLSELTMQEDFFNT